MHVAILTATRQSPYGLQSVAKVILSKPCALALSDRRGSDVKAGAGHGFVVPGAKARIEFIYQAPLPCVRILALPVAVDGGTDPHEQQKTEPAEIENQVGVAEDQPDHGQPPLSLVLAICRRAMWPVTIATMAPTRMNPRTKDATPAARLTMDSAFTPFTAGADAGGRCAVPGVSIG